MPEDFPIESARALEYEQDRAKLNQAIDLHLKAARERKWTRALDWFGNAAFLAGQHVDNFRYRGGTFTQDAIVIPSRFQDVMGPTMVDNHILRIVQANIAQLTGMNPYPDIEPASLDTDDIDLARVGEILLRVLWEKPLRVPQKLRQLIGYLAITGTGALESFFGDLGTMEERMKMKRVQIPDLTTNGELVEVEDWAETNDTEWVHQQGLRIRAWSGFHIEVNPDATEDPDSLTWICRSTFEDLSLMRKMFTSQEPYYVRGALEGVGPAEYSDDPLYHWEQIKDLLDSPNSEIPITLSKGNRRSLAQSTRVRMIDCRPNEVFPMGRTLVQIGGKLAYEGPSRSWKERNPSRWTPMRIARWWTLPGRFEGIPLISELKPLQKRVNALDVIIRLNRQYLGIGAKMIPTVCNVPKGFFGPLPGQDLTYRLGPRGEKPEPWQHPPLPPEVWVERQGCVEAMDRIGGIASAQLSSSPSALRAGVMLDFGQRQAQESKSAIMLEFESFIEDVAQDILEEASANMADHPELMRRVSVAARELGDLAIDRFSSLDLGANVRVSMDIRSQILQTPEAKKEAAGTFLQFAGQSMTQSERAKVAQIMGLDEIATGVTAQFKRARRMVERILQGDLSAAYVLDQVDDPGVFAEVIRDAMLGERAQIAQLDVKEALQALFLKYSEQLQARAQAMAQAALSAGGDVQNLSTGPANLAPDPGMGQAGG